MRGAYTLRGAFAEAHATTRRGPTVGGTLRAVLTGAGGLRCEGGTHRWSARRQR
jgi:hypothetical protein